jgi:hypothetical protein
MLSTHCVGNRTAGKPRVGKPEMGILIFSLRGMISTAPK